MERLNSFYLSEVLGRRIFDTNNIEIGRLDDILVSNADSHLDIAGLKVKGRHYDKLYIRIADAVFYKNRGNIRMVVDRVTKLQDFRNYVGLKFNLLDKQVVDVSGKKVVRVNDVKIDKVRGSYKIVAVDIGFRGLLRRLGIRSLNRLPRNLPDKLLAWNNIETLRRGNPSLKLTAPFEKLSRLHPADLADIIEALDTAERKLVMESLSPELAADTLEEMEEDVQINIIENLSHDMAVDLLSDMPPDEAADILDDLYEEHKESLLNSMDEEDAEEIREILEYPRNTVGSIMTTEFIAFTREKTVSEVIDTLRQSPPPEETIYYLYVVDEKGHLAGVVNLRQIIVSMPQTRLEDIMLQDVVFVRDDDDVAKLIELVNKYYLLALPVVDEEAILIGMAMISDIVDEVLLPKWKHRPA